MILIPLKKCKDCGHEKPLEAFYRHKQMKDGHLNSCKVCIGKKQAVYKRTAYGQDVAKRERIKHADKYREWKRAYKQTEKGKAAAARHAKNNYKPDRNAAQQAVKWALKTGKLTKLPCLICGDDDSLGHHPSYAPDMRLSVTWLCVHHHNQLHNEVAGVGLC